jgi:hypothetical protein
MHSRTAQIMAFFNLRICFEEGTFNRTQRTPLYSYFAKTPDMLRVMNPFVKRKLLLRFNACLS